MSVRSSVVAIVVWSASTAMAGSVSFDPPQATWTGEPISFDVSVSQTDLPAFDSVSLVFTYEPELQVQFSYAQSFLDSTTLVPAAPASFCHLSPYCHLFAGGNRFDPPAWTAPLLVGQLTVDASAVAADAFPIQILASASAETEILGTPLSMLVNWGTLEPLEGGVTITVNPEPATLILLLLGSMAVARPAHRFRRS